MTIHRLNAAILPADQVKAERVGPGRLLNVSVITAGEALGHGFEVDDALVKGVAARLEGRPGRWTHGGLSEDGLARHLGHWRNARVDGSKVKADFHFSQSAHKIKPDGLMESAPEYLLRRAEEDPSTLGVSIVADLEVYEETTYGPSGKVEPTGRSLAKFREGAKRNPLWRADFVADPAANPTGLHAGTGSPSELTEAAEAQLTALAERLGPDEARSRALAYVDKILGREPEEDAVDEDDALIESLKAEIAKLTALNGDMAKALETRIKAEGERFCASLQAEATAAGSPIPQEKLDRVSALWAKDEDTARSLGDAYLCAAKARGGSAETKTVNLDAAPKAAADAEAAYQKYLAERVASWGLTRDGKAKE